MVIIRKGRSRCRLWIAAAAAAAATPAPTTLRNGPALPPCSGAHRSAMHEPRGDRCRGGRRPRRVHRCGFCLPPAACCMHSLQPVVQCYQMRTCGNHLKAPWYAASAGAMYGTYEAFRYKVPGLYKVRYIGQVRRSTGWQDSEACPLHHSTALHTALPSHRCPPACLPACLPACRPPSAARQCLGSSWGRGRCCTAAATTDP